MSCIQQSDEQEKLCRVAWNARVVIKLGGSTFTPDNQKLLEKLSEEIAVLAQAGAHVFVVHGGGVQITEALQRKGYSTKTGLRATNTKEELAITRQTLLRINADFVRAVKNSFTALGTPLAPIRGVEARGIGVLARQEEYFTGIPYDLHNKNDLDSYLEEHKGGSVHIVTPVCQDDSNVRPAFNCNADTVAAVLATHLAANFVIYGCSNQFAQVSAHKDRHVFHAEDIRTKLETAEAGDITKWEALLTLSQGIEARVFALPMEWKRPIINTVLYGYGGLKIWCEPRR